MGELRPLIPVIRQRIQHGAYHTAYSSVGDVSDLLATGNMGNAHAEFAYFGHCPVPPVWQGRNANHALARPLDGNRRGELELMLGHKFPLLQNHSYTQTEPVSSAHSRADLRCKDIRIPAPGRPDPA